MSTFKDHFSTASDSYAAYRPTYPPALFDWLARASPARDAAWDCATGSGQAAEGLAAYFTHVVATDASAEQIAHARPAQRVEYRIATAEQSGLEDRSVALVTVAQAAHWFDLPRFYAEVNRVLRPGGLLALWGYGRMVLPDGLDAPFAHFYSRVVGPYWPDERTHVDTAYRDLPFPFDTVAVPAFDIEVDWDLPRLIDYVGTWSAVKRYRAERGEDPLSNLRRALAPGWGEAGRALHLRWPLFVRAGRARSD